MLQQQYQQQQQQPEQITDEMVSSATDSC